MDFKLEGKLVLVTGSTLGIGKALAAKFVKLGAHVIINGRSEANVSKAIQELSGLHESAKLYPAVCDFSSKEGVDHLLKVLDEEIKAPLDVVVNNLGIFESKKFEDITDDEWFNYFNVNVMSGVRLSRALLPRMLERNSGSIVFVASEAAIAVKPFMIHYSMTKTAQLAVSRGLAELTKGTNVRVNTVLPGPTWTEGVATYIEGMAAQQGLTPEELRANYIKEVEPTSLLQRFIAGGDRQRCRLCRLRGVGLHQRLLRQSGRWHPAQHRLRSSCIHHHTTWAWVLGTR